MSWFGNGKLEARILALEESMKAMAKHLQWWDTVHAGYENVLIKMEHDMASEGASQQLIAALRRGTQGPPAPKGELNVAPPAAADLKQLERKR